MKETLKLETGSVPSNEGERMEPYYASPAEFEALRARLQTISPEKNRSLQELQVETCRHFIDLYGDALSKSQIAYLLSENVIIAEPERLREIEERDKDVIQTSERTFLNDKQYIGYRILDPELATSPGAPMSGPESDTARHFWAGRIAVVPLPVGFEEESIDKQFLVDSETHMDKYDDNFSEGFEKLGALVATGSWAGMALHEKIHGIQKYDLPFPILEIIAHYYSNKTFEERRLGTIGNMGFDLAIEWWEEMVGELGSQLHSFAFGNLSNSKSQEIERYLKTKLDEAKMKDLFNPGKIHHKVEWVEAESLS